MRAIVLRTAVLALVVAAVTVPAPLALATARPDVKVPCDSASLASDIASAARGETLSLAAGCVYRLTAALPALTQDMTILGNGATLERSTAAGTPAFSLLSVTDGAISITDLNFRHGENSYYAGAITNTGGAVTVNGGTFTGNSGINGGAIYAGLGYFAVNNAAFTGNKSGDNGGAIEAYSGVIHITGCVFYGNSAAYGGAIFLQALTYGTPGNAFVTDSRVIGNRASQWGGGIANAGGGLDLTGTRMIHNHAGTYGGGLFTFGRAAATHTALIANSAKLDGGAVFNGDDDSFTFVDGLFSYNYAGGKGGGIENQGQATFTDSTIRHNIAAGGGGGIQDTNQAYSNPASTTLTSSAVADNKPDNCEPLGTIAGCAG